MSAPPALHQPARNREGRSLTPPSIDSRIHDWLRLFLVGHFHRLPDEPVHHVPVGRFTLDLVAERDEAADDFAGGHFTSTSKRRTRARRSRNTKGCSPSGTAHPRSSGAAKDR